MLSSWSCWRELRRRGDVQGCCARLAAIQQQRADVQIAQLREARDLIDGLLCEGLVPVPELERGEGAAARVMPGAEASEAGQCGEHWQIRQRPDEVQGQ